jgi:hypothetical protein
MWLTLSFIIFVIFIIVFEIKRKKANQYFDLLTGINISYIVYFGVSPLLFSFMDLRDYLPIYSLPANIKMYYNSTNNLVYANFLIILSYVFIILGYYIFKNKKNSSTFHHHIYIGNNKIFYLGLISFIISFLSLSYYTYNLNGIWNAIKLAEYYRAIDSQIQDDFMFLRLFQPFILSSFFCFLILNNIKRYNENIKDLIKNFAYKFMLVVTFILSIYYLIINAGRAPILVFIFTIILYKSKKIKIKQLLIISALIIIGFIYGDLILEFLITGEISFTEINGDKYLIMLSKFVEQTIYPYINVVKVPSFISNVSDFRFFADYIFVWIINMIPGAFLGIFGIDKIPPLWVINTNNFNSIIGGIPVDIISIGYYQLGFIGVILISFIFGMITSRLDDIFQKYEHEAIRLLRIRFLFLISTIVINAEPESIVRGNINIIVMYIVFIICSKKLYKVNKSGDSYENRFTRT